MASTPLQPPTANQVDKVSLFQRHPFLSHPGYRREHSRRRDRVGDYRLSALLPDRVVRVVRSGRVGAPAWVACLLTAIASIQPEFSSLQLGFSSVLSLFAEVLAHPRARGADRFSNQGPSTSLLSYYILPSGRNLVAALSRSRRRPLMSTSNRRRLLSAIAASTILPPTRSTRASTWGFVRCVPVARHSYRRNARYASSP